MVVLATHKVTRGFGGGGWKIFGPEEAIEYKCCCHKTTDGKIKQLGIWGKYGIVLVKMLVIKVDGY